MNSAGAPIRTMMLYMALLGLLAAGCERPPVPMQVPEPETQADSLALLMLDGHGGQEAWQSLRYVRFSYSIEEAGQPQELARHLWDRQLMRARVEWVHGDSVIVAVLSLDDDEGLVYVDGVPADTSTFDVLLGEALYRHYNDTYWLVAPVLAFDVSARREYVPDASTAEIAVVQVSRTGETSFLDVPHWFYVDRTRGLVTQWALPAPSGPDDPPGVWTWTEYHDFEVAGGVVRFSMRKDRVDAPVSILTDVAETPSVVVDTMFTAPNPIL